MLLVGLLGMMSGCGQSGPELASVSGKVIVDGNPVTGGAIIFCPDSANSFAQDRPSSLLNLDGTFMMKTYPFGEGVAPGRYKVILAPELASRLKKPKYAHPDQTPWEIEVPETGVTNHTFEVK